MRKIICVIIFCLIIIDGHDIGEAKEKMIFCFPFNAKKKKNDSKIMCRENR